MMNQGSLRPPTPWRVRVFGTLLALLAVVMPSPASASGDDVMCQELVRLENGRFTYRLQSGLSVLRLARADGPFVYDHAGDVIGFTCLRTELMPDPQADLEVLQAGYSLAIGGRAGPAQILSLELDQGRIRAEMLAGTLDRRDQRRLDRIVADMQARLDSAAH